MRIEIDHDLDAQGNVMAVHVIDSTDPTHVAALTAEKAAGAVRKDATWNTVSKHKLANPGETRWQFLVRQVNGAGGPANLKALNLT